MLSNTINSIFPLLIKSSLLNPSNALISSAVCSGPSLAELKLNGRSMLLLLLKLNGRSMLLLELKLNGRSMLLLKLNGRSMLLLELKLSSN